MAVTIQVTVYKELNMRLNIMTSSEFCEVDWAQAKKKVDFFKIDHSQPLFLYFRLFSFITIGRKKFADVGI